MLRLAVTLVTLWAVCCSVVWQIEAASEAFVNPPYGPLRLVFQAGLAEDQFNSSCCSADVSFVVNLRGRW